MKENSITPGAQVDTATRYNVYIVRESDGVAVSLAGRNMRGSAADRRSETVLNRINREEYWPMSEKVGGQKDAKYASDLVTSK